MIRLTETEIHVAVERTAPGLAKYLAGREPDQSSLTLTSNASRNASAKKVKPSVATTNMMLP